MIYNQIYAIANQGMQVEKLRVEVVARNIANQHALLKSDGTGFEAQQVVSNASRFSEMLNDIAPAGIASTKIVGQQLPINKVYQPEHRAADSQGYVNYPGVNTVVEMTTLLKASRAYEANIKIINSAHNLYLQALSIGEER